MKMIRVPLVSALLRAFALTTAVEIQPPDTGKLAWGLFETVSSEITRGRQVVSVGAVAVDNPTALRTFSLRGPTWDGRCKPDLYAPDGIGGQMISGGCQDVVEGFAGSSNRTRIPMPQS